MLLSVSGLKVGYGKIQVLNGISLDLDDGEVVGLVGHNGAGKSTLLKSILGVVRPTEGTISFKGQNVARRKVSLNVKDGIALVPQEKGIFRDLTVLENIDLAAHCVSRNREFLKEQRALVFQLFPILYDKRQQKAGVLSGGQQQMVKIGMALMRKPSMLLLDEPSLGLAPVLVERVLDKVKEINQLLGTGILLVEQNVNQTLRVIDRLYVMKTGEIVFEGSKSDGLDPQSLWNLF